MSIDLQQRVVRRKALLEKIRETYLDKQGTLLLSASFEREREPFVQDSSFFYFVGIEEPGLVLCEEVGGDAVLYEPSYATDRSVWLPVQKNKELLAAVGIKKEEFLGKAVPGYSAEPKLSLSYVQFLVDYLAGLIKEKKYIFTPLKDISFECVMFIDQLCNFLPELKEHLIDISPLIGQIRRKKDVREIEHMYKAIEVTAEAQEAAAQMIRPSGSEAQVHAAIMYVFIEGKSIEAFPSIVGSGKNSTVLHYVDNKDVIQAGDLVVVDIGASYGHYAADVTRTYPASGKFSKRQKEIYQCVLDAQLFIAEAAKPGMYLRNLEFPEQSLHHLACKFFEEYGYAQYFPHGIGHFVGLDVHDVGNVREALKPGDVITIEPGLYIASEKIGVRIEDMYWIVEDGVICLTEGIVKEIDEIEHLMVTLRKAA